MNALDGQQCVGLVNARTLGPEPGQVRGRSLSVCCPRSAKGEQGSIQGEADYHRQKRVGGSCRESKAGPGQRQAGKRGRDQLVKKGEQS